MQASTSFTSATDSAPQLSGVLRKRGKTPKPVDFLKLAKAAARFDTKKEARETLQNAGFTCTPQVVEELLNAVEFIETAHKNRVPNTILKRLGHIPKAFSTPTNGRTPAQLPAGTPVERLKNVRVQAVAKVAHALMRHGAAGGHTMRIGFALDESKVRYAVTMDQNRDTYAGAYKGWSASEDHHLIVVPKDWRVRVERKGLASLAGMMTLDAHPLIPDGEVLVYAATWARQSRSYDVKVDRGYIATLRNEHFHADSAQAAIKGVRRKVKSAEAPVKTEVSPYALTVDAFVKRYERKKFTVSVRDAQESGSCDFGIRSWCAVVGLDFEAGEAPLDAILRGFELRPQEEVRRAVLHAARRDRAERRARVS
jgi:hypothetical protein